MKRMVRLACMLAIAGIAVMTPAGFDVAPAQANTCSAIKSEMQRKVRPSILRLSKGAFNLTNWYYATLKKNRAGAHSTPAEISKTKKQMVAYCKSLSKKSTCMKVANGMTKASNRIYQLSARWARAKCPGKLS